MNFTSLEIITLRSTALKMLVGNRMMLLKKWQKHSGSWRKRRVSTNSSFSTPMMPL